LLRRIRRRADLSQRELADLLSVAPSTVARAELGQRDLQVTVLVTAAELAGLRLALLDSDGHEVPGMDPGAVRDLSGRRFPAHLDTRYGDEGWWHGAERYSRERPWYTFDRDRQTRDAVRTITGTPPDHQPPRPGDSPQARAKIRLAAADAGRRVRSQQEAEENRRRGSAGAWAPSCSCPPACDDLLFADEPLQPGQRSFPHFDGCPCGCDIA
jgi:transcriptional regulator with XRE-family HTH domain